MNYQMKQNRTLLIIALVLIVFVTHSIHRDNLTVAQVAGKRILGGPDPKVLAQEAYDKYKRILTRDDLLPLLPDVLTALKDRKFANPNLAVEIFFRPPLLREHIPNVDERFITLLDVPEIRDMFADFEMRRLYGVPASIDALLELLAPHLKQVKISQVFFDPGPYSTLRISGFQGLQIDGSVSVGTIHTLIFTLGDAAGNPVPGLPLTFSIQSLNGTAATGTFNPVTVVTSQTGSAQTQVTFGSEPGDIRLTVKVDTQRIVELVELELLLGNTAVDSMVVAGIGNKFALTNTTQTLVFTARDANGRPVSGEELTFGARSASGSAATAVFSPAVATTDQNGMARTQVTFGSQPGGIYLAVQAGSAIRQVNITASQMDLGSQITGTLAGLQIGDSVDVGTAHTLVFTARDKNGKPVSGLPVVFGGAPLEATFVLRLLLQIAMERSGHESLLAKNLAISS